MTKNKCFSFRKGWKQLSISDAPKVKEKIMAALSLQARASFYYRLNGKCEPTMTEAQTIEAIFREYGVTKIWGDE